MSLTSLFENRDEYFIPHGTFKNKNIKDNELLRYYVNEALKSA